MKRSVQAPLLVLLALSLGAGAWLLNTRERTRAGFQARIDELQKQSSTQSARAAAAESENQLLREQLSARGIEPAVAAQKPQSHEGDAKRLETVRELSQTQTRLFAASSSITELQNKVRELEASLDRLSAENKRISTSESNLKEDVENANRVVQAMETEIRTKNERLAQLEPALRRAREDVTALNQKLAQSGAQPAELADINRRRENTLNSLQRRYRDLTDQLRALAVRLDTERDNPTAAVPDISRIQTAVQSAEDDLRQLISLNTQAQRLTQKFAQK